MSHESETTYVDVDMKELAKATVDVAGLMDWTGARAEDIETFVEKGVIVRDEAGQFPLIESLRAMIKFWQDIIDKSDAELAAIIPHGNA